MKNTTQQRKMIGPYENANRIKKNVGCSVLKQGNMIGPIENAHRVVKKTRAFCFIAGENDRAY